MSPWQQKLETALSAPDAPAVFDRDLLSRFARSARGTTVPESTLSHWLKGATGRGRVVKVIRGVYLNRFRSQPGTPADAADFLRRDAIVSLNTVLGDAGVLNNPSLTTTVVVPLDDRDSAPRVGRIKTAVGWYHFFAIPRHVLEAGKAEDNIDFDWPDHVRATPERALIDWLYLAQSRLSKRAAPSVGDLDLDLLDRRRLKRLANATGVSLEVLERFKARAAETGAGYQTMINETLKDSLERENASPKKKSLAEVLMSMPNVGRDEDFERIQDDDDAPDVFD